MKPLRETVTIFVPNGYTSGEAFVADCGFELAMPPATQWDAYHNRSYEPVESLAKEIYTFFDYKGPGEKPAWVTGGNSNIQDEARTLARRQLRANGHNT